MDASDRSSSRGSQRAGMHFRFIANPTLMLILDVGEEKGTRTKSKLKAPGNLDSENFPMY
jgi:hypothetical protein